MPIMSQDYNINMKQYNGSDYDNILPLAYNSLNSDLLNGNSYGKILTYISDYNQNNNQFYETGLYIGSRKYGKDNPNIVSFDSEVLAFCTPIGFPRNTTYPMTPYIISTKMLTTQYQQLNIGNSFIVYIKISENKKEISWYVTTSSTNQFNTSKELYYYGALTGAENNIGFREEIITDSGNFIVPITGKYYIELYGGGGGGWCYYDAGQWYQGGSSCQSYNNISLVKRENIAVTIGKGGTGVMSEYGGDGTNGESTTFGNYTVSGGSGSKTVTYSWGTAIQTGSGARNLGQSGLMVNKTSASDNFTKGVLSLYRFGGGLSVNGGNGAVYLKYLGE